MGDTYNSAAEAEADRAQQQALLEALGAYWDRPLRQLEWPSDPGSNNWVKAAKELWVSRHHQRCIFSFRQERLYGSIALDVVAAQQSDYRLSWRKLTCVLRATSSGLR